MKKDHSDYRLLTEINKIERPLEITGVYSMFTRQCADSFYFSGELHAPWELVYVMGGEVSVTADDRIYRLYPGDLIFHKPLEMHKIWAEEPDAQYFVTSFDLAGPHAVDFRDKVFRLDEEECQLFDRILSMLSELPAPVYESAFTYYSDVWARYPLILHQAVATLEVLMMELLRKNSALSTNGAVPRASLYAKIVRILEDNAEENLTIVQIADQCQVSTATLKKYFSEYAGCGIHKYYLRIKLRRAIDLLRNGLPVSEVSERLGFNNPNYFASVFRRELGHSPSYYR